MTLRAGYFLLLSLMLKECSSFSVKHAMDIIDVLETKFEMANKLRRSEMAELFDKLIEIDSKLNKRRESTTKVEDTAPSNGAMETMDNLDSGHYLRRFSEYLVKGSAAEKRENVENRAVLTEHLTKIENMMENFKSEFNEDKHRMINQEKLKEMKSEMRKDFTSQVNSVKSDFTEMVQSLRTDNTEHVTKIENLMESFKREFNEKQLRLINQEILNETMEEMRGEFTSQDNSIKSEYDTIFTQRLGFLEYEFRRMMNSKSCSDLLSIGKTKSGVYNILYPYKTSIRVYCDQTTEDGGWTVFQRRQDGSVDFERSWADYKTGFGDLEGEFWLGNEYLHILTAAGKHELRIDMEDYEGNKAFAKYSNFRIKPETDNYAIEFTGYSGGNADDSLSYHNGMPFSTKDRDNDQWGISCSKERRGAWWYKSCHYSNLNGFYYNGANSPSSKGIIWLHWRGNSYSLKRVEMKLR